MPARSGAAFGPALKPRVRRPGREGGRGRLRGAPGRQGFIERQRPAPPAGPTITPPTPRCRMTARLLLLLTAGLGPVALAGAADWPQWRGPQRDGVSQETGLLPEWPKDGP